MSELTQLRDKAAHAVFRSGTVHVDLENGFELKVHETFPKAPRSPFYASLRPEGVKDGLLSPSDFAVMGRAMVAKARSEKLIRKRSIVGIPAAGEPLVDAFIANLDDDEATILSRQRLIKVEEPGQKRYIGGFQGSVSVDLAQDMLVFDDLMTNADTKIETKNQIEKIGGTMSDMMLFLNRSVDGIKRMNEIGVKVHVVWDFDPLMEFWLGHGYLKRREYEAIMEYPDKLKSYITAQTAV